MSRGVYWAFWIALFMLAAARLLYLVRGYSDFGTALSLAIPATGFKYYAGTLDTDRTSGLQDQLQAYRSFAKRALLWSGPTVFPANDTSQLDEGLAFGVVISSTVGLDTYNIEPKNAYSRDIVGELLPLEVYNYLGQVRELEKIDRYLKYVAKRMGTGDNNNLLHDIRAVILQAVFDLTKKDTDAFERQFSAALMVLSSKARKTPPIQHLIMATKAEYERNDSRAIEIGNWRIVSSWIKINPPNTFDDLLGESGLPIPAPLKGNFRTYDG